eukprot:gene12914-8771_t
MIIIIIIKHVPFRISGSPIGGSWRFVDNFARSFKCPTSNEPWASFLSHSANSIVKNKLSKIELSLFLCDGSNFSRMDSLSRLEAAMEAHLGAVGNGMEGCDSDVYLAAALLQEQLNELTKKATNRQISTEFEVRSPVLACCHLLVVLDSAPFHPQLSLLREVINFSCCLKKIFGNCEIQLGRL